MSLEILHEDLDESVLVATATFEDVRVLHRTEKALLVFVPSQVGEKAIGKVWIPLSVIDRESEVLYAADFGYLIVKRWYSDKQQWA